MPVNISDLVVNIGQNATRLDWNSLWTTLMSGVVTLSAAFFGSFMTYKLYEKEKHDKATKEIQLKEEEKVKNLNILLIQFLECIDNTLTNLNVIKEQEKAYLNDYKDISLYVMKNNCDAELINRAIQHFIIELPGVVLSINNLSNLQEWSKIFRERRNELIKNHASKDVYEKQAAMELDWLKKIVWLMIPNLLVIYDFAISNFGAKYTILKISEKEFLKDVWKYLHKDFKRIDVESKLQYQFKNEAIIKWFFEVLKQNVKKKKKNVKQKVSNS